MAGGNILRGCILTVLVVGLLTTADVVFSSPTSTDVKTSFVYNDHGKRDPLWSLLGNRGAILNFDKDVQASDMVLEGILAEPTGGSVAIINGKIINVGDRVGFFIVKEIQGNIVILEKGQEIITLKLKKEE